MSSSWRDDDEDYKVGGVRGGLRSKPRFSFAEVKLLLEAVKRNRYIILRKFNQGVSAEAKKQTWAEITEQVNSLGENRREVRQIMKKWADLKCDGKRRIAALRGPNGTSLRKKRLGPVEKMVHKILSMSPRGDGDSDVEFGEDEDFTGKGPPSAYSYLSIAPGGINLDFSPLSSPEKEVGGDPLQSSSDFDVADEGEPIMDFDENDDSLVSSNYSSLPPASSTPAVPPPDDARLRIKPLHTYSRNNGQNPNHTSPRSPPGPPSPVASTSDAASASTSAVPPPPPPPSQSPTAAAARPSSSSAPFAAPPPPASPSSTATASDSTSPPAVSSAKSLQPPSSSSSSSSSSVLPPKLSSASGSAPSDPFPASAFARRPHEHVAQLAAQSVQQQQASRALLSSVSQSLEILAQSVQLLVESQQEFVQESLLLQRETVDILRDFSNTALSMLRDKSGGGGAARHQNPPF